MAHYQITEADPDELIVHRGTKYDESPLHDPIVNSYNDGTPFKLAGVPLADVVSLRKELHAVAKLEDVSVRIVERPHIDAKGKEDAKRLDLVVQAKDRITRPRKGAAEPAAE